MRLADLQITNRDHSVIARLVGEVDLSNAENIGGAIAQAMRNDAHVLVLDLSNVDYLDSAGIHLLYRLRESLRARDQILRLVIPSSSPASDALGLAGIMGHIETVGTLEEAFGKPA